jgi:hypothetical protein
MRIQSLKVMEKSENALKCIKLRKVFGEESKHLVSAIDELAD